MTGDYHEAMRPPFRGLLQGTGAAAFHDREYTVKNQKLQSARDEETGLLVLRTARGEPFGTIGTVRGIARAGIIEPGSFINRDAYIFVSAAGQIEQGVFYATEEEALEAVEAKQDQLRALPQTRAAQSGWIWR